MSLEIYPKDFHTRYGISHAISVMLSGYYDQLGKIIIVVPITDYYIQALGNEYTVYDTETKFTYIIQNVKQDTKTGRISAYGFTCEQKLDRRVLLEKTAVHNVESDIYHAITKNLRGLSGIRTAPLKGLPETANGDIMEQGQLQRRTSSVLHAAGLGRRAIWDDEKKEIVYEIYKGVDRTEGIHAVVFSDEQGSARNLIINDDVSDLKNVAYIVVEFRDKHTETISVGKASADDRREIFSTRRIIQGYDESDEAVRQRAKSEAALELARNIRRLNFSVAIDPEELGKEYSIGDIVACTSIRFGVSFTARVSGVKYVMDTTGQRTEIILGTPTLKSIGGLILND